MAENVLARLRKRPWPISVGFAATVLGLWQTAAQLGWVPSYIFGPLEIVQAFVFEVTQGDLLEQVGPSLRRALSGFAIGATAGILLGLLAGVSKVFRELFDLTQAFTHPIPKIALFPAIAVILGFTDQSRILIISISAFYPAYLNAMNGALGVETRMFWVGRNMGASRFRIFRQVVLPASLPRAVVGLRISLMISFIMMVATEVVGFSNGLGAGLMGAYHEGEFGTMYAGILAVAISGVLANLALRLATDRLLAWQVTNNGGRP
jgi:ABC-type nitrate/sulfonate/bicarbonate transport system permease component